MNVILAAFLTVLALMVLVRLPENPESVTVTEQNSVYDLTGITNSDVTLIRLAPGNTYYPNIYLTPESMNTSIPENVDRYDKIRADYLSQRFVLLLPNNSDTYTLTFKLSGRHAMRVYVNGRLAAQTGHPGTTKQDTEIWENNITFSAAAVNGKMDIILHSAQFYHAKRGASLAILSLSKAGVDTEPFASDRIKGLLVMGALLSAAVSLMGIYLMLAHTKATLYFAMACIAMSLRECVQSQAWTYFPISGNISFMLEYLSVVLLTIFLSLYLGQYALEKFLKSVQYTALVGSGIYGICVLFGDSIFYTSVLKYYQLLLLLCIIPGVAGLFWKLRRPAKEQAVALYGIAVFFLSAVADIVMYLDVFGNTEVNRPVSEATMLIFALAQAFSLYLMNNRVLAEAREVEQKLVAEKAALESLDRMKTEFLGNISHELKTPLAVISGYAQNAERQLLASPPETADAAGKMKVISSEAKRLGLMVGQILDITRIEEGRMNIETKVCGADELINVAISTYYPMLNKNNNRLEVQIEEGLPDVLADPVRVSQVLANLISNAVRFTADGKITVSAKEEGNFVAIRVADTGTGIIRELLPFIFDRYVTKQKSGSGQDTGTGLGLYICRHIVEAHGGTISVESEEGKGTTFRFTIPVA
ncbi:sensor histidine kinase [Sporanaerobacter sp. PP17-6a]|uniref:sensor histidine kinase n=1 Tax=Sporanaerobacter sp. PP17-6a TaxID=1891289 RepID=UPI0008A03631|nr:sensor histidine kinase [Sporanaerobacter sp. PP17-6a]SCL91833.1 Sensor protein SrrB [Sporanaerobacter sp. PP17-6a]